MHNEKCFDDAHGCVRQQTSRLAQLLYFIAVQRFGHLNVEYTTRFFKRASRRGKEVYGNPRTTRPTESGNVVCIMYDMFTGKSESTRGL